ncbi:MAG: endonuclease domain-containing protein [bacterium]
MAKYLRKNSTDAEKKLWSKLRNGNLANLKFRRQVIKGPYILDFYCPEKRLVIEVDGGQHYTKKGKLSDKIRKTSLNKNSLNVIRYSNRQILLDIDVVLKDILNRVKDI